MAEKKVKTRIQQKHDVQANWDQATGFIPYAGELIIYDADSTHSYERFKIGDGTTTVVNLPFRHMVRTAGDITVDANTGAVTVNDDSHSHGNIGDSGTLGTANAVVITDANKKITTASITYSYNSSTNTVTFS